MLKINESFAKKYEEYRRKEELQKFKDRYGDVKLSDAKRALGRQPQEANGKDDGGSSSPSSSSSESEDSECEGWTPNMEAGFLRVYSALQTKDSKLYDPGISWFPEEEKEASAEPADEKSAEKHKPMYYNEYHRNYLLAGAYKKDEEATGASEATDTDLREAEQIRDSLAKSHATAADSGSSSEEDADANFLVKRCAARKDPDLLDPDPMLRIHKFVCDPTDQGVNLELEPECKKDLAKLKRHWTDDRALTDAERYLRDYITKEYWRPDRHQQKRQKPVDDEAEDDEQLSDDEAFLTRQAAFESRWNLRTESSSGQQPDPEFESEYRRTLASGEAAVEDDEEDDDDDELFVVKKESSNKRARLELDDSADDPDVVKELNRLERRKQWKDSQDAEYEDAEAVKVGEDAQGTAATEAPGSVGVRTYPRRIADSLRQATSESERTQRRTERRARRQQEKLARRRELDRLVAMKEAELARSLERLRRNAGEAVSSERVAEALGGDFLDAEFDPREHDRRMAELFGDEYYTGGQQQGDEKKPRFSDDEEEKEDEVEAARRLRDEVEGLRAEDLIRAGPGEADLRCRFNYRQTEPNDFGLSAVEILLADDRELNAWCSVRKASQYREREADWRDRRRYRSARVQERKDRLMPGLARRLEAAAAFQDAEAWERALAKEGATSAAKPAGDAKTVEAGAGSNGRQQRRRRKKKQQQQEQAKQENQKKKKPMESLNGGEMPPRCRKKKAKQLEAADTVEALTGKKQQEEERQRKKKKTANKSGADRLQISEQRLLELGIDPRKFRRIRAAAAATTSAATSGDKKMTKNGAKMRSS